MTKKCTLKESFIEKQLDKFQPGWRTGEDITAETKQKIRNYVTSKLPKELKEDVSCITDYSIWHMAKKIRERENLPTPQRSNVGGRKKVSICQSQASESPPACADSGSIERNFSRANECKAGSEPDSGAGELAGELRRLINKFGFNQVMSIIAVIQEEEKTNENAQ